MCNTSLKLNVMLHLYIFSFFYIYNTKLVINNFKVVFVFPGSQLLICIYRPRSSICIFQSRPPICIYLLSASIFLTGLDTQLVFVCSSFHS